MKVLPVLGVAICFALWSADPQAGHFRVGISTSIVRGVNENDARAAMKGWADALARQTQTKVVCDTYVANMDDIIPAARRHEVDAVALTTPEFVKLGGLADPRHVILESKHVKDGERYLILVRTDGDIKTLAGLKGKRLVMQNHPSTSMAEAWLEVLMDANGLGNPDELLGRLTKQDKLSRGVVLPVFFRQMDACLVTERGFNAMVELNPQLGKQLRALATSPGVLSSMMVFHRDYSPPLREFFQNLLLNLPKSTIGDQMQTLFQVGTYAVSDVSALQPSLDLLAKAERIRARTRSAKR